MNINQRLNILEQRTLSPEPKGVPLKPMGWTDGEHMAVVKGLGLTKANLMSMTDLFIKKYQIYIDQIRSDYNNKGITPDKPIIKAQPLTYSEVIDTLKAKYDL